VSFDLSLERLRARPGAKWSRHPHDVLPAWVADMDVEPAPAVRAALQRLLDAGDLGYPEERPGPVLAPVFVERMRRRFAWTVDADRVVPFTDVVQGIEVVLHLVTEPGDGVMIQTPIYPPFLATLDIAARRLVDHPLQRTPARWELDVEALGALVETERPRVLLLCNPHNPSGRAFRRDELEALAAVAAEHDLLVVSDEIWADLVHAPNRHIPFATISGDAAARTVTLTSATKAFAMPAVKCAVAHVGPDDLLARLVSLPTHLFGSVGQFGVVATVAAWEEGDEWLAATLDHLAAQRKRLVELMEERLPAVPWVPPEATYLAWLDCRPLGLPGEPCEYFLEHARVALGSGPDFGVHGEGFVRLNFATTDEVLTSVVERMASALATT
jgi:cystathionine beta-lyase